MHDRKSSFDALTQEVRFTLDDEGRFLHLEGAWASMLGWQPGNLRGNHWENVVHPADLARFGRAIARLRSSGGCERDLEIRIAVPADGHRVLTWTLITGSGPDAMIGVGRDRAEEELDLRQRNRELEARLATLEERHADVERFAGMAAHQLSEPLVIAECSAIMVSEELGETLDPVLRSRLEAIGRGAARARQLIDALLQDARTSDGKVQTTPVDVAPVVANTLAELAPQIDERRVTAMVGALPTVRADAAMLSVVFDNLLSNAFKYGPREGGEVRVGAELEGDSWRLFVASEGTPIPPTEASRIFEPFRRVPGERRAPGHGLGLAICARLVERLGGRIGVAPGETVGNTFWVVLPDGTSG